MGLVIAIDGPAGSGKSTLASRLAKELQLPYVNTGLMYRALTSLALRSGVDPSDAPTLGELARGMRFWLADEPLSALVIDGRGDDPAWVAPDVEGAVSAVASHDQVRAVMRREQRALGGAGAVMEGRDIGSVVFPDADVKIFLQAPARVRAGRRARERGRVLRPGEEVVVRDARDDRTTPLRAPEGAVMIDTTGLSSEEVFQRALRIVHEAVPTGEA